MYYTLVMPWHMLTAVTALLFMSCCRPLLLLPTDGAAVEPTMSRYGGRPFEALFAIGDSLLDPGNDQKLTTLARADRPPYGRDLASHAPSGRFCNGLLTSDIVASLAGLSYPPAYLLDKGNVLQGTSFASSGAGIMNLTGFQLLERINFFQQVSFFADVRQQIVGTVGMDAASALISRSLFLVCLGSNDYLTNYFGNPFGQSSSQRKYTVDQFRALLISMYEQNLRELYRLGARKFALVSVGAVGCIPLELLLQQSQGGQCISSINEEVKKFNQDLLGLSANLQASLPLSHFTFLNSFDIVLGILANPTLHGFEYGTTACYGSGPYNGIPCYEAISSICPNASEYVFWDFAHPTQALNQVLASRFWTGRPPDVQPFNLQQLASL